VNISLLRIFEQLAFALKNRVALKFFKPEGDAANPTPPPRTPMTTNMQKNTKCKGNK